MALIMIISQWFINAQRVKVQLI